MNKSNDNNQQNANKSEGRSKPLETIVSWKATWHKPAKNTIVEGMTLLGDDKIICKYDGNNFLDIEDNSYVPAMWWRKLSS